MKNIAIMIVSVLMTLALASMASAATLNVETVEIEIDGFEIKDGDTANIRQLERGEEFDVRVRITAPLVEDSDGNEVSGDVVKDVEINAFVSGFEQSRSESISDSTRPFDLGSRESVVKTLTLTLPERADEDKYKLRVFVSDRNSESEVFEFNIKIEPTDAEVVIRDFEISPQDEIEAGRALLATVRVKNLGDSDEDDVKIRVSVPELGLTATPDFIDELESDESATSEEFFIRVPSCTRAGVYDVIAEVTFDEGDEKTTARVPLTVSKGSCDADSGAGQAEVSGKTTLAFSTEAQSVAAGGNAQFPITITNGGSATRAFMISAATPSWASGVDVNPSNLVTVRAGQTQTVFVSADARSDAAAGERSLTATVSDSQGNTLQTITFTADVAGRSGSGVGDLSSLRDVLTAGLIVVVAILVVIGLVLAFRRAKGDEGESQTYY